MMDDKHHTSVAGQPSSDFLSPLSETAAVTEAPASLMLKEEFDANKNRRRPTKC